MKVNCNLIKDILPLYVKGETSDESNTIISEHLEECEDCRALQEMLLTEDKAAKSSADESFGKSMKKVKRRFFLRTIIAVLTALAVVSGTFLFVFWGVIPVKSTDVEIVPEVYTENVQGTDYYCVDFHLTLLKRNRCIDLRHGLFNYTEGPNDNYEATVYSQIKLPYDERGKKPECRDAGVSFKELTGEEEMVFHFRDKDVVYNIKELVEAADLL